MDISRDLESGLVEEYRLISVLNDTHNLTAVFSGALDLHTGLLTTGSLSGLPVDREVFGDYLYFSVNLTDANSPWLSQTVNFTVRLLDLNDNSPIFEHPNYTFYMEE